MRLLDWLFRGAEKVEEDAETFAIHRALARDARLSEQLKDRAVKVILGRVPPDELDDWAKRLLVRGEDWYVRYHHGWGTAIRNLLRREGIHDLELPGVGNWDDFYGEAVNAAVREHAEAPIREQEAEQERAWAQMVGSQR